LAAFKTLGRAPIVATAILFDLYETLVTERDTVQTRAGSLGEALGLDPKLYRPRWKALRPRVVRGELSLAQALHDIGSQLGVAVGSETVQRLCLQRAREKVVVFERIDPDLAAMIRALRDEGLRLAVLSNALAEDVSSWPGCSLDGLFDVEMFSFAAGVAKPDPAIYEEALRRLDVTTADAVFIGDGGDDELGGATRVGLRAYRAGWYATSTLPSAAETSVPTLTHWREIAAILPHR
jgi:HAD superfamily hydrolase (TIGR01509 family)